MGARITDILAFAAISASAASQSLNAVPAALSSKFGTGVNVTRWFCYEGAHADPAYYRTYLSDRDFAEFKRLGVKFVRLCISPDAVYSAGRANPAVLPFIDAALDRFEKAGIAVVWDLHDNGQLKLDQVGHDNSGFVSFWQDVAKHYKSKRESSVVFELLNEPQFTSNPQVWYALQSKTVEAIREIDPRRTVMVTSTSWSGIDTFIKMPPLPEKNLIYTFHCYDPFFFTHQGASWVGDQPKLFKSMPFPSSPEVVAQMIDEIPPPFQKTVRDYGAARYDADYMRRRIGSAAKWGKAHGVPVVLGEFGAFPPVSPPESRGRWWAAMRAAVDEFQVPHAIWGYDDALGLGRKLRPGASLDLDPVTLRWFYRNH
jgi:endoglucanase